MPAIRKDSAHEEGDPLRFLRTGNTRAAADCIAEALSRRGFSATVWDVRVPFSDAPNPNKFDVAGFGYPIHAFNTPQFFLRFAKTLPQAEGMPAFFFKTSGEPFHANSASSRPLIRILQKKGFRPLLERHLLMPYNIMFRYPDALAKQMYRHTQGMAEVIARGVAAGEPEKLRFAPWTVLGMYCFRLQWFGAWINGPLIHVKKDLCSGCGLCAQRCPSQNIQMKDGLPHFSYHCTMCMSCAFRCPKDAVRPGFLNAWRVNGRIRFKSFWRTTALRTRLSTKAQKGISGCSGRTIRARTRRSVHFPKSRRKKRTTDAFSAQRERQVFQRVAKTRRFKKYFQEITKKVLTFCKKQVQYERIKKCSFIFMFGAQGNGRQENADLRECKRAFQ
jgi:NAD-dependent dihydropyrimidine dehydrogenase PreA subunit